MPLRSEIRQGFRTLASEVGDLCYISRYGLPQSAVTSPAPSVILPARTGPRRAPHRASGCLKVRALLTKFQFKSWGQQIKTLSAATSHSRWCRARSNHATRRRRPSAATSVGLLDRGLNIVTDTSVSTHDFTGAAVLHTHPKNLPMVLLDVTRGRPPLERS